MRTYCIDRSQGEGEVEVVAVVDISVLHKPQIFISHHLRRAQDGHLSRRFLTATVKKNAMRVLSSLYLIDACRHLLYKKPLLLSLTDQAGEQGETVVVGPGGTGRGLWGYIR